MKKFLLSLVSLFMLTTLALADLPLEAGMYYLYNPLSGKFLSRGNAWGTSAVVDDYGVAINVEVADQENGTYTLKGFDNNLPYGFDDWMFSDCSGGNADKARKYTLTSVEGGFTITNTNNGLPVYVYMNEADPGNVYRVAGNGTKGDNYTDDAQTVWQFKTPAERNEIVATREAAEKTAAYTAAGLTEDDVVELGDPTELTFATGSIWEKTVVREQDGQPVTNDNGTEMWQATGNFTQAISNLDPGLYKVSIQAFYRNGSADECMERDATGYNTVLAYLEANGNKIQVKSWTTDKGEGNDPNDMGQAKSKFDAGKYLAEGYAYVGEDGILNLKVDNPAHIGNGWFIVSNVKYAQVYLDLLYADAVALAADENAVAVGKLLDAIEAYKTDRNTATLKLAMDQFQQDNADLELDVTSKVGTGTDKWVNAQSCPAGEFKIFSHKGIDLVQVFGVTGVGNVLTQEVDVENGLYNVALYATSHNAWDGKYGVNAAGAPTLQEDADDVAYVFASSGENSGSTWITARHNSSLLETEPELYNVNGIEVENGKISFGLALAQAAKTEWHCIQIASLKMITTAKDAYNTLRAEMQAQRTVAVSLLADPYKTEGHTELQAAIEVAEAAIMSNKLNVPEFEAAIAALESAIDAFKKANYATFTGAYYIQAPSGKYMAAGHSWGTQGFVNEAGLDLTLATLENNTVTFDSQVANNETDHFLNKGLYMDGGAYGWIIEQVGADTYTISDGTKYIGVDENDNLVLQNEAVAWKFIAADDVQAARMAALEAATAESGVDATFLIKGANFNRNDARNNGWTKWSQTEDEKTNLNISGGNNENNCAESYHAHFYVKQAIANAPKGVYKLSAQGFYRQDDEVVEDGAVFFIGDQTAAVPLKTGIEDNMSDASVSFTEGKYTIDPIEFVFSDGDSFEVGVQNETAFHQWIIFDNFQLTYYGPAPVPAPTYAINIAVVENGQVEADVENAAEGATVTLTATPAEGYMVDEAHVTYGENVPVELNVNEEENTATFVMPAADVNVLITFKEVEEEPKDQVIYDWNFTSYGEATDWLPVNTEAESVTIAEKQYYPTTMEKWQGLYAQAEKIRLDKNTGLRAYSKAGDMLVIPGLKKNDIIEVTGTAGGGSGTDQLITAVTENAELKVNAWNDLKITMTEDGDLGFTEVYFQATASNWYSIATIKVTRPASPAPEPEPVIPTLANGDFEGEYTVYASPNEDRDIYQPAGWTITYENGDGNDMTALNSGDKAWNNFENKPQLGEAGGNNTYWVRFRWGDSETLTLSQQVNLTAGNYKLTADAFFNGADGASATISAAGQSTAITGNSTWVNHKVVFTVTEEGPVTIALNVTQTKQVENIAAFDNVKIEAIEDIYADLKAEVATALEAKQSVKTKNALETAFATFTAEENETNADALKAALAAAKVSINSYKILETGIIPDNSLEGWTCTNSNTFHINTWSTEGNSDGTNMTTPFIENWVGREAVLGTGEIYYSLPGLDPGIYSFTALIRAYSESGNEPTGASLFAMDREKEFATGKNFEFVNKDNTLKGIYDTYAMSAEVGEDGVFKFGIKIAEERNFNWMAFKNCRVAYVGAAITEEAVNELAATMPESQMNADVKTAADAAIATAKATPSLETYEAAQMAIAAAKASAEAYSNAKSLLDDVDEVLANTNVYTAEAYETYTTAHATWTAKYEDGTLTDEEAASLRKDILPSRYIMGVDTWHWANTTDDFLLSAWTIDEVQAHEFDTKLYINMWSMEGYTDGSDFKVPFFEYWVGDGDSLGEATLKATISGLTAGETGAVDIWVRVRAKNGVAAADATGITLQVNDGEPVDVTEGDVIVDSQFSVEKYTATGLIGEDGKLFIKLKVAAENNISWLSFKDVTYSLSTIPTAITEVKGVKNVGSIYDLSGRKVEKMVKGVYIVNGKKVSVK